MTCPRAATGNSPPSMSSRRRTFMTRSRGSSLRSFTRCSRRWLHAGARARIAKSSYQSSREIVAHAEPTSRYTKVESRRASVAVARDDGRVVTMDYIVHPRCDQKGSRGPPWFNYNAVLVRSDEIGESARAFNDMADRIAKLLLAERELLANVLIASQWEAGRRSGHRALFRCVRRRLRHVSHPARVEGRDRGIGIAQEGLALARRGVVAHDGSITFESEPGHGTVARVRIPGLAVSILTRAATPPRPSFT